MQRQKYGKMEQFGWEIDHIKPLSKGGTDDISNLQPLQWENNRHKADDWPDFECKVRS
jgi:5-methylcytosine-specific restriction endonuclease McrA